MLTKQAYFRMFNDREEIYHLFVDNPTIIQFPSPDSIPEASFLSDFVNFADFIYFNRLQ